MSRAVSRPLIEGRPPVGRGRLSRTAMLVGAASLSTAVAVAVPTVAQAAIKVGTPSADVIRASASGDTIYGGGGADTLTGGPGNDVIYGVRSGNRIDAGAGDNYVEGGTGNDVISAGDGRNTVYGSTGADTITLGNGSNYVDPGGATDQVTLGDGDNVVNGGTGGLKLRAGNGNNVVYYRSGPDEIVLGSGVNLVYLGIVGQIAKVDCGGNPKSVLFVNAAADPGLLRTNSAKLEGKIANCPTIQPFEGPAIPVPVKAPRTAPFDLVGTEGNDVLLGGHGGGTIDGRGGNDSIHADRQPDSGGSFARAQRTRIDAGDGDNVVYGGRGTNDIRVGSGRNFIRGGAADNTISTGAGQNVIRLRGRGVNRVSLGGGTSYVEAFNIGAIRPRVTCENGARAVIVYGVRKPVTNCTTVLKASTKRGKQAVVQGIEHAPDSDPVVSVPITPGQDGHGVARPPIVVPPAG